MIHPVPEQVTRESPPIAADVAGGIGKGLIDSVSVALEAFVGEARLTVADLTGLDEDSVVTLDAALNRAVELRLNGVTVARGELVAVGDNFGVRLTEISR